MSDQGHGRSFYRDDEITVDRDGTPHYTGEDVALLREYEQRLSPPATEQRRTAQEGGDGADAIEISEEWWDKLTALPFVSQTKGKTLHLLKKQAKPVP